MDASAPASLGGLERGSGQHQEVGARTQAQVTLVAEPGGARSIEAGRTQGA